MALEAFLETIHKYYCGLHSTPETIDQIHDAIKIIVRILVNKIGEKNSFLIANDIIEVGSFAEGTKIRAPNEFDYMISLTEMSDSDKIDIKPGCHDGFKVIFIKDAALQVMGTKLYWDYWCLCRDEIRTKFRNCLNEVVGDLKNHCITKSNGQLVIKNSEYQTACLEWRNFGQNRKPITTTDTLVLCELDGSDGDYGFQFDVNIDLMPCLVVQDIELVTHFEHFPKEYTNLLQERGCHFVLKACESEVTATCMQISFAACEVYLMENLHLVHKKCYQILKYLLVEETNINHPIKCINLSSYTIKTAFLFHEYEHLCDEPPEMVKCIKCVVKYLKDGFRKGVMPSFFIRNLNVWGQGYRIPVYHAWSPKGLDDERALYRADWSQILWLEFWRQVLNQFMVIFDSIPYIHPDMLFENIDSTTSDEQGNIELIYSMNETVTNETTHSKLNATNGTWDYSNPTKGRRDDSDKTTIENVQSDNVPTNAIAAMDILATKDKDNIATIVTNQNVDSIVTNQTLDSIVANQNLDIGVTETDRTFPIILKARTRFNDFMEEFKFLKNTIIAVTTKLTKDMRGPRTKHLKINFPKEEHQRIALPKFDEYLRKMEELCSIEIRIPTHDPN